MKLLGFAWKNVRNNPIRAGLTLLGVSVAVFVFCFFQSMQHTMSAVVARAGADNNLVVMKEHTW